MLKSLRIWEWHIRLKTSSSRFQKFLELLSAAVFSQCRSAEMAVTRLLNSSEILTSWLSKWRIQVNESKIQAVGKLWIRKPRLKFEFLRILDCISQQILAISLRFYLKFREKTKFTFRLDFLRTLSIKLNSVRCQLLASCASTYTLVYV